MPPLVFGFCAWTKTRFQHSLIINPFLTETCARPFQNSFVVAEGKSKAKGKERRVFLFEKYLVISEPVEREAGLPAFKHIHSLKVCKRRSSVFRPDMLVDHIKHEPLSSSALNKVSTHFTVWQKRLKI